MHPRLSVGKARKQQNTASGGPAGTRKKPVRRRPLRLAEHLQTVACYSGFYVRNEAGESEIREVFRVMNGSHYNAGGRCEFVLWAPSAERVDVKCLGDEVRILPMERAGGGYWTCRTDGIEPGTGYFYVLNGDDEKPDPASHYQPGGVHGPSAIVDHEAFAWTDEAWTGLNLEDMILYELHVGVFTEKGTFECAVRRLDDLLATGINAVSLMPVAQFPGDRNWGYDGAYPYAVQNSYGGPSGLKQFVNECHARGLAVILDVVYNHLGPEGNYLGLFAPYFTDKYRTLWGRALNFDGPDSDGVREYFIGNALHWFRRYHIDGLRLDAVHSIFDMSAKHFLAELSERTEEESRRDGRKRFLIAESNLNDIRILKPREEGGCGIDAQWNDDFHHSLHTLLTADRNGYYSDFGNPEHFIRAWSNVYVLTGQYSAYRRRRHGAPPACRPASQFVVFSQNHDQIGNRMHGDRHSLQVSFEALKLAAGAVILSPYIPMLFMGEEYGEESPFLYFVSHSDKDLIDAVRQGRKHEFKSFEWEGEPPDPQARDTFERSRLRWESRSEGRHAVLHAFYRRLIELRKSHPVLSTPNREGLAITPESGEGRTIICRRSRGGREILYLMNFDAHRRRVSAPPAGGVWRKLLDSSAEEWGGPGASLPATIGPGASSEINASSLALYELETERHA